MAILTKVGLVPTNVATKFYGKGNGFNAEKSNMGLFARNRGLRNSKTVKKLTDKSANEITLDKQNLKKRLLYSTALNSLVREMGESKRDCNVGRTSKSSKFLRSNKKFKIFFN